MTTRAEHPTPGPGSATEPGPRAVGTDDDFADFYHRTYTRYLAYALSYTASPDRAQDVVHDTFIDLYTRWDTIRQPVAYGARTLRHKLQDQARRMTRTILTHTFLDDVTLTEAEPGDAVVLRNTLVDALRMLPPVRRRIVVAYYLQDFTTDEIATTLAIAPSTVRAHLVHARRDLRALLTDQPLALTDGGDQPMPQTTTDTDAHPGADTVAAPCEQVYDRYVEVVYRYIVMLTGTGTAAEDLTSKTFRYALAHREAHGDPKTWLMATARTFVTDEPEEAWLRTDDRHDAVTTLIDAVSHGPADDAPLDIDTLLNALQSLNRAQYECIVLRFLQGMTVAESAHVMDRTEGAVKVLQHRALRNLTQHLEEETRADNDGLQPADISQTLNAVVAPQCSHYIRPNTATHQRMRAAVDKRCAGEPLTR
ncbi:sigma-70 family RNA polymerase sigma factor [Streptomyces sp. NPDC056486]|uniref:sigma-70 family RNA polymerase sigma factor n=1 Tax=Streptomyces sp. NPDC056486 TaxID=3345835 RepID=UPI0036B0BD79